MKIVIANSVGINERGERYIHFPSRWSAVENPSWYDHSKGWMTFYPFNLAYLSALLKRDTDYEVKFLDGNLNNWNHEKYLKKIIIESPDWLIMETSTLAFNDDMKLASAVKKLTGCKLVMTGQHPTSMTKEVIKRGADFVCQGEYEFTVLELLTGVPKGKILGLYPNHRRPLIDINKLPWPEDEDVCRIDYIEPCVSEYREIEMFATRGCPQTCNFCVASNLYYGGKPSWRTRDVSNIIEEIKYLKNRYPQMEGIFFDDEAHNGKRDFIMDLTREIIEQGLNDLHYNAMCGYWSLDKNLLEAMKEAGYYKLRIGIETANLDIAKAINKNSVDIKKLYNALEIAKDLGIKIYGTFIYGAMGSSKDKDMETTNLIVDLLDKGLMYDLQHSICTPQPGTPFFNLLKESGYLDNKNWTDYDGSKGAVFSYPNYTSNDIKKVADYTGMMINLHRGPVRFINGRFDSLSSEIKMSAVKRILFIRSGPLWQTAIALKTINYSLEDGSYVAVITQPQTESFIRSNIMVSDIYIYKEGFFKEERYNEDLYNWLKNLRVDLTIFLYNHNSENKSDYSDVEALARLSKAGNIIGIDTTGEVARI